MKFFILRINKNYVAPSPLGWFGKIDIKTLERKKPSEIPEHLVFQVDKHMQMVFTDIITAPCFMISEMVFEVIKKYDPFLRFIRIVLYAKEHQKSMIYYIPFLDKIRFEQKSYLQMNKSASEPLIIEKERLRNKVILEIEDNFKNYIIVRMDLLESILRRDAIGIGAEEVKIV